MSVLRKCRPIRVTRRDRLAILTLCENLELSGILFKLFSYGDLHRLTLDTWFARTTYVCMASLPAIFLGYSVARTRPPAFFYNNHPLSLFMISWTDFTGYLSGPESTSKSPHSPTIPSHLAIRHTRDVNETRDSKKFLGIENSISRLRELETAINSSTTYCSFKVALRSSTAETRSHLPAAWARGESVT